MCFVALFSLLLGLNYIMPKSVAIEDLYRLLYMHKQYAMHIYICLHCIFIVSFIATLIKKIINQCQDSVFLKDCMTGGYVVPRCSNIDDYRAQIESLPAVDSPEVFGLHPNADITYQTNTANTVRIQLHVIFTSHTF